MTPKALSREIKFRMWGIKDKFMDDTPVVYKGAPCTIDTEGKVVWMPQDDTVLMQYTGLHDKNGNEIYEGDFVMFGTTRLEVIWDENRVAFATLDIKRKDMGGMQNKKGRFGEIIGNIYENPELLN